MPISRTEYLRPVFKCLAELIKPDDTELIIITDGDKELEQAVDKRLDSISYHSIQVLSFGDSPAESINDRRFRISAIHNKAKHFINPNCDYVYLIEDDSVYPADALEKMQASVELSGYVTAIQLGRHKTKYIGAWIADDIDNPTIIKSVMPEGKFYEPITAGGLFCCLVRADLYRNHTFEPFDKQGTNGLSCDVNFGFYINRMGYTCYLDWSIETDHIGDKGSVNLGNTKPVQVIFEKRKGKWSSRVAQ